jgi:hypothetical protein
MKVSASFDLEEFVDRETFQRYREKSIWFIDPKIIALAEFYRMHFKAPVTINTWHKGGQFQYRGFRPPACKEGAALSQHRFGRAFDCTILGLSADEVRAEILSFPQVFLDLGLSTLENGTFAPTWVHSDIRNTAMDLSRPTQILIVKP